MKINIFLINFNKKFIKEKKEFIKKIYNNKFLDKCFKIYNKHILKIYFLFIILFIIGAYIYYNKEKCFKYFKKDTQIVNNNGEIIQIGNKVIEFKNKELNNFMQQFQGNNNEKDLKENIKKIGEFIEKFKSKINQNDYDNFFKIPIINKNDQSFKEKFKYKIFMFNWDDEDLGVKFERQQLYRKDNECFRTETIQNELKKRINEIIRNIEKISINDINIIKDSDMYKYCDDDILKKQLDDLLEGKRIK